MYFFELINEYWLESFGAFFITFMAVSLALWVFPKLGLMDRPKRYGLKRDPIPYYGGVAIFAAFLLSVLIFVDIDRNVMGLLISGFLIALVGFLDDLISLSPIFRLFFQFLAAGLLAFFGIGILSINLPFVGTLDFNRGIVEILGVTIPLFSAFFTIIWIMTIVNTVNFIDGVSGLTSGVSFLSSITIFVLSVHPTIHENPDSQLTVATIALIVAMVSLAFLIFDFPKPKILMGDTGSTFLGFMLASLAIFSGGKVATAFLVLGIPILDMVWVVLRRTYEGKKFWHGDLKHLHHRLMDVGLSKRQVLLLYFAITAVFGLAAISFVSTQQKLFIVIALVLLMLLLAAALIFIPGRNK